MDGERVWVATLYVSDRTAQKISQKHGLEVQDVEDAIVCVTSLTYTWDEHPERGRRALIETRIGGRRVLVVLYPANDPLGDGWHLGSAYPI